MTGDRNVKSLNTILKIDYIKNHEIIELNVH